MKTKNRDGVITLNLLSGPQQKGPIFFQPNSIDSHSGKVRKAKISHGGYRSKRRFNKHPVRLNREQRIVRSRELNAVNA